MKINIKNTDIELKFSFRALMIYENITQESFSPDNLTNIIFFFYSVILGSIKNKNIDYDEFMDWLDENPNAITEFTNWLTEVNDLNAQKQGKEEYSEEDEKPEKSGKN